jgi:prephenate dehydrogenase
LNNRDAVLDVLGRFKGDLADLEAAVRDGDGGTLQAFFTEARKIRREVIKDRVTGQL